MPEILSFYTAGDFELLVGKVQKKIAIPRMRFETGEKVAARIAEIQAVDTGGAVDLIFRMSKGDKNIAADISKTVKKLINEKSFKMIVELLLMISEGALDEKVLVDAGCQYDEAVKILAYLVESNFGSLKNLSASLGAIISSGR